MVTVFWCEDSLDGILTGVYDAWDSGLGHGQVKLKTDEQDTLELFCENRQVQTELEKAEKVLRTIRRRMGEEAFEAVCYASACVHPGKADAIYRFVVLGLSIPDGREAVHCLQQEAVSLVMKLRQKSWHEAHRLMGFLRFEELENGILYARFRSVCAVLPLLAPHFADRFRQEDWVIHDLGRGKVAVHRKNSVWVLAEEEDLRLDSLGGPSVQEQEFQRLWKTFCKSIAIEERNNPRCQQNLLPLRFRPCMTEFQKEEQQNSQKVF